MSPFFSFFFTNFARSAMQALERNVAMFQLPRVMGHRGAAATAPENTLAGLRAAAAAGLDWVEFDAMLTVDGVPVLFHDDSLKRTTGRNAPMAETSLADLTSVEAGSWFAPEFKGEPVPSLEEALKLAIDLNLRPNIEIKPTPGRDVETATAVVEVLVRCWPAERPIPLISSFSRKCLGVVRDQAAHLPRALLAWWLPPDWRRATARLQCSALHIAGKRLTPRRVRNIKKAGFSLAAFTVNDPDQARELVSWGVDCIITDDPDKITKALK